MVCLRIAIASITRQQSLLLGVLVISLDKDVNASSTNVGSHLKEADHFLINDGFGKETIDRMYL